VAASVCLAPLEPGPAGNAPADATGKEIGRISLTDVLELTILIARKDPRRHPRVAARWLLRYLEEHPETIDEAALAASCLAALRGYGQADAAQALRAMAERATSRGRTRDVPSVSGPRGSLVTLIGHGQKRDLSVEVDVAVHAAE
jgi:hypothetical protein